MDGNNRREDIINRSTVTTAALAAAAAALIILITLPQISGSGSFQVFLTSYLNDNGLDSDGNCCSGSRRFGSCSSSCRTLFRVCLSHFQSSSSASLPSSSSSSLSSSSSSSSSSCSFGSAKTPVLGENSFKVPEVLGDFVNPIDLPFAFTWPGSFSLTIEAWHDSEPSPMTPYANPGNKTENLISRLSFQQNLDPSREWHQMEEQSNETLIRFRFRILCSGDYYGSGCSEFCRPRNDTFGHYNCSDDGTKICLDGWKGEYCNTAKCSLDCHETHGTCEEPNTCRCRLGWKGERCDECVAHPGCEHGSCVEPFSCHCDHGWGGILCTLDLNFCDRHRPCLNGATCMNTGHGDYTCLCPPGLTGTNCEMDTGDCRADHLSCLNGGRCLVNEDSNGHECHCALDFHGRRCEVSSTFPIAFHSSDITCSDHPCLNGGRCIHEPDGFRCLCQTEFEGDRCQTNGNRCSGIPCRNNGSCVDEINGFRCHCRPGFTGRLCQLPASRRCSHLPCGAGATCVDLSRDFRCVCAAGFTGRYCTVRVAGACLSQPCLNGGSCIDIGIQLYNCTCPRGYTGRRCNRVTDDIYKDTVTVTNDTETVNVTSIAPQSTLLKPSDLLQVILIACLGTGVPFTVLTVSALCLVLRRKRNTSKRKSAELENDANETRCLNNQSVLPLETVSLKTVSEQRILLNSNRNKKNFLLEDENERRKITDSFTFKNF